MTMSDRERCIAMHDRTRSGETLNIRCLDVFWSGSVGFLGSVGVFKVLPAARLTGLASVVIRFATFFITSGGWIRCMVIVWAWS